MNKTEMKKHLTRMLNSCIGFAGDETDTARKQSYDYYFQRARGDEIVGRSTIVSGDLSSMVEGNLATMSPSLMDKRIGEFCSYDIDDVEQAQTESDCVHEMLFKRQNGFIECCSAIKDAFLVRNAVVKVYVDSRTYRKTVRKSNVSPEVLGMVMEKLGTVDVHSYSPRTRKLSATVIKTTRKFRVEAVAPENFLVPKGWHRQDLEGIPFCAERHIEPRSALIERGFARDDVDQLPPYQHNSGSAADARLPRNVTNFMQNSLTRGVQLVEWFEAYALIEQEDGTAELRCISFGKAGGRGGLSILADEDAETICYATGTCIINPHSFTGISLHDKLKSTQDSTTALTRALMDNLNVTSKNRTAYLEGVVEESDMTDARLNGSIRVNGDRVQDVRAAVTAFSVPDTSANILQNLQHFKGTRAEMGGSALDMSTANVQLNDRVGSMGLDRAYSVMEAFAALMTRTVANTLFRSMYMIAHEVLRTEWDMPIGWKRGKEWIKTNPSEWPVRESVLINLGASLGERARLAGVLEKLMAKQVEMASLGMEDILVNVECYYTALTDWLRINDVPNPERFILDPRTPDAIAAFKRLAASRQQTQMKQDALAQQAIALEQLRTSLQKYTTDVEIQWKYYNTVLSAQIEEAKLTTGAVVDLKRADVQARAAHDGGSKNTGSKESSSKSAVAGDIGESGNGSTEELASSEDA